MSAVVGPRRLGVSGIETEVLEQPTTGSTVAGVTPPRGHVGRIRPGSGQHQRIDVNTRVAQAVDPAMTVHELGIAEPRGRTSWSSGARTTPSSTGRQNAMNPM
jgi:hypothetical protein